MTRIRENTVKSIQNNFVSKGDNCNCWDRVNYSLPCPCVISRYPGELPLAIVDKRWWFEDNTSKCIVCSCFSVANRKKNPLDPTKSKNVFEDKHEAKEKQEKSVYEDECSVGEGIREEKEDVKEKKEGKSV